MAKRMSLTAQLQACELMAELLAAGFALPQALRYLQIAMPSYHAQWQAITATLAGGGNLSQAFVAAKLHPLLIAQVLLAETHGQLAESLKQASAYLRLQAKNRRRLQQLMLYPALLLGLLLVVQLLLWLAVMPSLQLAGQQSFRPQLVALVLGLVVIGIAVLAYWCASPLRRFQLSRFIPGVHQLTVTYYQYQFVVGASHFLAAGLDLSRYCQQLAQLPPGMMQRIGETVAARLASGAELHVALQDPLVYPPVAELVRLGQTERLVQTGMAMLAQSLFVRLQARYQQLLALVQPVMFLLIGVQIVLVYLDVLGPLYRSVGVG